MWGYDGTRANIKPAAIPSDDLIREWEQVARSGKHITEFNGVSPCQCWCGEIHEAEDQS